jgi:hypothetical protein
VFSLCFVRVIYTLFCSFCGLHLKIKKADNSVITSKFYSILATIQHEKALREYILRKTKWMRRTFDRVDCNAHHSAFKKLTVFQKISTTKLIHNLANTNRQNYLYYSASPLCPGCLIKEETFEHVLICDHLPTA